MMLTRARVQSRSSGILSCPTALLRRKSTVCGLNGYLPALRVGSLHLNPRPSVQGRTLLLLRLFAPSQTATRVSVLERKIALGLTFSLLNGILRFRERKRRTSNG